MAERGPAAPAISAPAKAMSEVASSFSRSFSPSFKSSGPGLSSPHPSSFLSEITRPSFATAPILGGDRPIKGENPFGSSWKIVASNKPAPAPNMPETGVLGPRADAQKFLSETRPLEIKDLGQVVSEDRVTKLPGFRPFDSRPQNQVSTVPETKPAIEVVVPEVAKVSVRTEAPAPAPSKIDLISLAEQIVRATEARLDAIKPQSETSLALEPKILPTVSVQPNEAKVGMSDDTAPKVVVQQKERQAISGIGIVLKPDEVLKPADVSEISQATKTIQIMAQAGLDPLRVKELVEAPLVEKGIAIKTQPQLEIQPAEMSQNLEQTESRIITLQQELLSLKQQLELKQHEDGQTRQENQTLRRFEHYYFLVDKETMANRHQEVVRIITNLLARYEEINGRDIVEAMPYKRDDLESGLVRGTSNSDGSYPRFLKRLSSLNTFSEIVQAYGPIVHANLENRAVMLGQGGEWATHEETKIVLTGHKEAVAMNDRELLDRIIEIQLELLYLTDRASSVKIQHTSGDTDRLEKVLA